MLRGRLGVLLLALLPCIGACKEDETPYIGFAGAREQGGVLRLEGGSGATCRTPAEGCPCESEGASIECGEVQRRSGDYVSCSMGRRSCKNGRWGSCVGDRIAPLVVDSALLGRKLAALGAASNCTDSPCDPYCMNFVDDTNDLQPDGGCTVTDAGLTLIQREASAPSACTGLQVEPASQTVVVTSISPLTMLPANVQFSAKMVPEGCAGPSSTVAATWTLNSYESALIDGNGKFNLYAPVAQTLTVTAYSGSMQASAQLTVLVAATDTSQAPANTADKFVNGGSGVDPMTVLYPYADTVFPRGLTAPLIQWTNNGTAATAVKVSLRYPATGSATLSWSKIIAEPSNQTTTIPQSVWAALDQTASGNTGAYVVQRLVGTTLYSEVVRRVRFSNAPLRGRIYYTEYGRSKSNPLPSPSVGGSCSFSNGATYIRALNPNGTSSPVNPFQTIAPGGCPVCHSVSANGKMFVTSERSWGSGGGVSRINSDSTFTLIADSPQPPRTGEDSRGFAYGAVTPDGTYVLQGTSLWGNTKANGQTSGTRLSAGNGNGLKASYYNNISLTDPPALTRVDQQLNFDWGTGSPGGAVNSDNFSVRWTGQLQPFETNTHTIEVEASEGVRLWIDGQLLIDQWTSNVQAKFSTTMNMVAGTKYDLKIESMDTTGAALLRLRWSAPGTSYGYVPQTQLYGR